MSEEAKEFLVDNGYMDSYDDDSEICNIMDEYFAFRLGKMIFDGKIKRCDDAKKKI